MQKENLPYADALSGLWENALSMRKDKTRSAEAWNEQHRGLAYYGRGMEEALQFLYHGRPAFDAFMDWVQLAQRPSPVAGSPERILTLEDLRFWEENGFLVVKNVVSAEQCEAARSAIWEFLGAGPDNPASWYQSHPGKNGLMLSFFQHPALYAIRNAANIRKVYEELYGTSDIFLPVDKVSFNPPETGSFRFKGSPLHWDVSLQLPVPDVLQGLVYLNDVTAADGAFHCVPGFHKKIASWLGELPEGVKPRDIAPGVLHPLPVPGNAGDLVIWHQALPHCATPNKGTTPRMVQYIAYKPVQATEAAVWK